MSQNFDIEKRWPKLFEGLDAQTRWRVLEALGADWHARRELHYEDVKNLTDYARGDIGIEEWNRRIDDEAKRGLRVTGARMDLEERWPELFEGLDARTRRSVVQSLAGNWHAGWEPNYEDVKNFTDYVRGDINIEEYHRRVEGSAKRGPAVMAERLDLENRWPELFEGLDARRRRNIVQSIAANWREGWEPDYEDVKNRTDCARGDIDVEEYDRRAENRAKREL